MEENDTNKSMASEELSLAAKLEALLFYKGEPETIETLARVLGVSALEVSDALAQLSHQLSGRGLSMVTNGEHVELRTSPRASAMISALRRDELSRELGAAGAEVLAIVLYTGSASRAEIDRIRGANSSHTLRSLSMRGLVERIENTKGERSYRYRATTELLAHLGVADPKELPDYHVVSRELTTAPRE